MRELANWLLAHWLIMEQVSGYKRELLFLYTYGSVVVDMPR